MDEDKSYTSSLLAGGLVKCIDKLQEEFDELTEALNNNSSFFKIYQYFRVKILKKKKTKSYTKRIDRLYS